MSLPLLATRSAAAAGQGGWGQLEGGGGRLLGSGDEVGEDLCLLQQELKPLPSVRSLARVCVCVCVCVECMVRIN